jgi:phosphoglycerate dehydrogenase-like enzyme
VARTAAGKKVALFYGYSTDWKVEDGTSFAQLVADYQTTDWSVEVWKDDGDEEQLQTILSEAQVLIGGRGRVEEFLQTMPKLQLMQIFFTGYDWLDPTKVPAHVTVANNYGMEVPIAEHVMGEIIQWKTRGQELDREMKREKNIRTPFYAPIRPFKGEVAGCTLGIVGAGHIAKALAKRAKAFDMRVVCVTRTKRELENFDRVEANDDATLRALLQESDFVALTCNLTETNGHMLNAGAVLYSPYSPYSPYSLYTDGQVVVVR